MMPVRFCIDNNIRLLPPIFIVSFLLSFISIEVIEHFGIVRFYIGIPITK